MWKRTWIFALLGLLAVGALIPIGTGLPTLGAALPQGSTGAPAQNQQNPYSDAWLAANHGQFDNIWTAEYESQLQKAAQRQGGSASGPLSPLYGPDVRISNGNLLGSGQNEFQIAINPTNNLNAIGTSNDGGTAGVGIFRTTDGGFTWTSRDASAYGVPPACCDPGVVFGSDGRAYAIILDTSPAVTYIIRSNDGGATWPQLSQVATPDRPNIAVDPSNPDIVYLTYSELTTSNRIKGYKSTDGGQTWGATFFVGDVAPAQGYEQASQPQVASNGWLYVGYQQYTNSGAGCAAGVQNVLARSTDGGATFSYTVVPIVQGGACSSGQAGRGIFCINGSGGNFRSRSQFVVGIKRNDPTHVYVIYAGGDLESAYTCAGSTGFHSDILFRRSTDSGATFSAPLKINTDGQGKDQYFPWMGVTESGQIWVGWNDRREDPNDYLSRWYQSYSNDEGATWLKIDGTPGNDPVADVQTQPSTFIGDYHGLDARNGLVLGIWYDSRNSGSGDAYTDPQVPPAQGTATPTVTGTPPTATGTSTPPPATSTRTATPGSGSPTPTTCAGGSGTWTQASPIPTPKMRAPAATMNNAVYVFGGRPDNTTYTQDVYRYDLSAGTWSLLPQQFPDQMSANMAAATLTFPEGPRIVVVGGNGTGSVYTGRTVAFNPADGSFTTKATWPASPMHGPGGWAVANNKLYVFGGFDGTNMYDDIWAYDPTANTWTQSSAHLSLARGYIATETMPDGLIYLAGGSQPGLTDETIFEKFNPATNTITTGPSLLTATSNNHAYHVGGELWVVSGGFVNLIDQVQIYSPSTDSWRLGPSIPNPVRNYARAYGLNGEILVIGGTDAAGSSGFTFNQKLTPSGGCATGTPTPEPPSATATTAPPSATRTAAPATATGVPASATRTTVGGSPTATPTLCPINFSDVHPTDYFYTPVQYLYCHGVISGYADGTFRPYNDTTRAQMVKIVVLGFGIAVTTPAGGAYTFHDVPPGAPFFDVIETAAAHNIISGYTCGTGGPGPCDPQNRPYFLPNNSVTRGQLSKIDVIAAGWPQINPTTPTFTDVPAANPFYTVIETAVCHGVVSGYADHTFHPFANATRGQISKIVYLSILDQPGSCAVTPAAGTK